MQGWSPAISSSYILLQKTSESQLGSTLTKESFSEERFDLKTPKQIDFALTCPAESRPR